MSRPPIAGGHGRWSVRQVARATHLPHRAVILAVHTRDVARGEGFFDPEDLRDEDLLPVKVLATVQRMGSEALWPGGDPAAEGAKIRDAVRHARYAWGSPNPGAVVILGLAAAHLVETPEHREAIMRAHAGEPLVVLPVGAWASEIARELPASRLGRTA